MPTTVPPPNYSRLIALLRPHHWSKNLLVLVPLIVVHRFHESEITAAAIAFMALSLIASATYIVNDLMDAETDRRHPEKQDRAIAAGAVRPSQAIVLALICAAAGAALAAQLPPNAWITLAGYAALSIGYSIALKRLALVDVIVLAALYTLRIIAGGFSVNAPASAWLLAFSMFVFFSLALLKRHTEASDPVPDDAIAGRGYLRSDEPVLLGLGTASASMSVLILALYINSDAVNRLYSRPQAMWLLCPLMFYWLGRCWLLSARRRMPTDPIAFAVRDPISYLVAVLAVAVLAAAV